jgi:dihydrolipoyl dehydrogenase
MEKTELAIIGAGPGGYAAAFLAADKGMQVTLIDPEVNPGGVCLYKGCIPSKALLHIAKVISEAEEAKNWGVAFGKPKIDVNRVREWKNEVVKKLTGGLGQLIKQRKINYVQGETKFSDSHTLEIGKDKLGFVNAIIATGSYPAKLPGFEVMKNLLDSTSGLELESIPETLLVVGGGYIGLELGTVYAALGTKVSVVELTDSLLPGVDKDLVAVLSKRLSGIFDTIMLNKSASDVKGNYEKILVAVGRKPNTERLGLENTKVQTDKKGFIKVNEQRRTSDEFIFAIGDVAGEPMLAHKASHEGFTAVEAIAGEKTAFEPLAIPAVVFTDPEIAWCGLTETQARAQNRNITVSKFPWAASGRAATLGRSDGLTKLIIDPESERILGVGIAGPGAGELIAEGVLAVEMGANAKDMMMTIHPHPTLSETLMESAESFFGISTHVYRRK